jgi:hypothetical protein
VGWPIIDVNDLLFTVCICGSVRGWKIESSYLKWEKREREKNVKNSNFPVSYLKQHYNEHKCEHV